MSKYRHRMSRGSSKRVFKHSAGTHVKNVKRPIMRGTTRL